MQCSLASAHSSPSGTCLFFFFSDSITTLSPARVMQVYWNNGSNNYEICTSQGNCSDARYKRNLRPLDGVLHQVSRIGSYTFEWADNAHEIDKQPGEEEIGVIAQEVESVYPHLVGMADGQYVACRTTTQSGLPLHVCVCVCDIDPLLCCACSL